MIKYAVVIERGEDGGYGAYLPDLPGCVAVATTEAEVRKLIREAVEIHLKSMREDGHPIPQPSTQVEYVALAS